MTRRRGAQQKSHEAPTQSVWAGLPLRQIGIVGGVVILIGAVLFSKTRQSPAASPTPPPPAEQEATGLSESGGSVPLAGSTTEATNTTGALPTPRVLPETQLDRLLQAGEPIVLFFHSNTCAQCIKMTGIVEQVYPDFSDSVALVDVNVYDDRNKGLLERANIRAIPTLIFINGEGEGEGYVGVMEPDALRQQLATLGGE